MTEAEHATVVLVLKLSTSPNKVAGCMSSLKRLTTSSLGSASSEFILSFESKLCRSPLPDVACLSRRLASCNDCLSKLQCVQVVKTNLLSKLSDLCCDLDTLFISKLVQSRLFDFHAFCGTPASKFLLCCFAFLSQQGLKAVHAVPVTLVKPCSQGQRR